MPLHSPAHAFVLIDAAGQDHQPYLLASPVTPDAAIFVVDGRTGLGRSGIQQIRLAAELGISQVILYINQFGQPPYSGRMRAIQSETEALIEDHSGLSPAAVIHGNYKTAVREMEARPKGPFSNCLSELAAAMYSLVPRTVDPAVRSGYTIPAAILNLEGGFSVAPLPDGSHVKIKLSGTRGEIDAVVRFVRGPEWKDTPDDRVLRSGQVAEVLIQCKSTVSWQGAERFSLFLNDTLRATGIAAVRSAFEPFASANI